MGKPIVCVDFDGVVHSYEKGWQNGKIYGELVPGFVDWAIEAAKHFTLVIYSSRSRSVEGRGEMFAWFKRRLAERMMPSEIDLFLSKLYLAHEKPAAFLTIDDRCVTFKGDWSAPELQPDAIAAFKPWMMQDPG